MSSSNWAVPQRSPAQQHRGLRPPLLPGHRQARKVQSTTRCASPPAWSSWPRTHRLDDALQRPVSRTAAALQGRPAGRRRRLQRHRHAGTGALARPDDPERRGRRGRGRHAVRAGARHAPHRIRAEARRASASITRTCVAGGDLNRGTYTGQAGPVYIEPKRRSRRLRPRSVPRAEGVRARLQPRRRHGDGRARGRAGPGAAADGRSSRRARHRTGRRVTRSATSSSASTAGCSGTASRSA